MSRTGAFILALLLALCATGLHAASQIEVRIEGLDSALATHVRAGLTIEQERNASDLTERRVERYHQRAEREIRLALQPFGYYHPVIEASLSKIKDRWQAVYRIDTGPPVILSHLQLSVTGPGEHDPALLAVLQALPIRSGDRLLHSEYERAKNLLRTAALDNGYREARYLRSEVRVYQQDNRADITLLLESGDQYRFGPVSFSGSELSPDLLQAYVPFKTGATWSNRKLLKLQRDLIDSNYFDAVNIVPLAADGPSSEIPLAIELTPRKNQKYSVGIGYATDTGPQLSLDWQHRRLNRHGHRLDAGASASDVRQDISATYAIPLARPNTDVLEFTSAVLREDTEDVESLIKELRVSHNIQRNRWRQVISLGYKREDYQVGGSDDLANLLIPRATWTRVEADNRLIARQGTRFELETSGAHKGVISDTSFIQGITRGKLIYTPFADLRLVTRAEFGASGLSQLDQLPASNRFFAGGDNSVRGYAYRSLGPEDDQGELIGGKNLAVGSVEFDYQFINKWYAATFYDVGNAFNGTSVHPKIGAGVGLRWASPVGMVRVDVAWAISDPDRPWRLHINFGPDF
jgi:translocation and assembly module TamA